MEELAKSFLVNIDRYPLLASYLKEAGPIYIEQLTSEDYKYIVSKISRAIGVSSNELLLLSLKKPDPARVMTAINNIPQMLKEVEMNHEEDKVVDLIRKAVTKEGDPRRDKITWNSIKTTAMKYKTGCLSNFVGLANSQMVDMLRCLKETK